MQKLCWLFFYQVVDLKGVYFHETVVALCNSATSPSFTYNRPMCTSLASGGRGVGGGGRSAAIHIQDHKICGPFFYHDVVLKKGNIFMEYLWHLVIFGNDACLYFKAMYTHFASSGRGVGGGGRSAAECRIIRFVVLFLP